MPHAGIASAPGKPVQLTARLTGVALAHLVAAAGCYEPTLRNCTVQCESLTDCAGGQVCRNGWCASEAIEDCREGALVTDAHAVAGDAASSTPDARDICGQGCSAGTCVGGVCVIDCSAAGSCPDDIMCPANLPCRVVCGDSACGNKINCTLSASCTVECYGTNACRDEIMCNTNECNVTCSGSGSCDKRTRCGHSCACDVTCSGVGSCGEVSECPLSSCRVGNGCSSTPVGCSTCS